ncbi:putative membrane protein [Flammeovirgaceae bacterium 311]|nr:putative membrane protein [Flammeovirgaceae bacterium 311]
MKFWEIFRFEIYYQLRRPSTWFYFLAILGLICLVLDEFIDYAARTGGEMLLNSPVAVAEITGYASKFSLLLIAALAGDGAMRDIQAGMHPLLYTTSLSKISCLGGRFLGTFSIAAALMLMAVPASLAIASFTADTAYFGAFKPLAYINSGLFLTLPNVFIATALIYSIVFFSRRAMAAYLGGIIIFVLSTFSLEIFAGNWTMGKLIDPSGITVINALSTSLPPLQLNSELVELKGFLLANRALWISITLIIGVMAYFRFQLSFDTQAIKGKQAVSLNTDAPVSERPAPVKVFNAMGSFSTKIRIFQTTALAWHYFREILLSPTGLAIPAIAIYAFIIIPNLVQGPLSVPGLPTTHRITMIMNNAALEIMVVMFITLITGQVLWGERDARLHEISDAVPIPTTLVIISKFIGLALVLITLQAAIMAAGISIQMVNAYFQLEIGLYLQVLFGFQLVDYLLLVAVAMVVHVVVNQKYVGHMLVLLFYLYTMMLSKIGIEHKLLAFGSDPGLASSSFYRQGPFMLPWIFFKLYWIGWALVFMVIAQHFWIRGRETGFRSRLKQAYKGFKRSRVLLGAMILVVIMGAAIFYNTNILNEYHTAADRVEQQVSYERLYGKYTSIPQPHLTGTRVHIELYPDRREAVVEGIYNLKNSSKNFIDSIHLDVAREVETSGISFNRKATAVLTDKKLGYLIYALEQPLRPGDSLQMNFEVRYKPQGFTNREINTAVINNGTYFSNKDWFPAMGYQAGRELRSDRLRKEYGLTKRGKSRSPHDAEAVQDIFGQEQIIFRATVGTASGQIAVAPGSLIKRWSEGGRQYFQYAADNPIRNMYHIYSANYAVRETRWREVDIHIFHQPQNTLNLDRMEKAMKASLAYYSEKFSPYQFRQLKLVEYPDPGTGGISFPGTIGYTSNFALLNTEGDSRELDLPFAAVAHEVAHQWWAHQLIPAGVEGAALISESLAWYSAFGVVEQVYGPGHLRNLVEAMRQAYLSPRSRAAVPLLQAEDYFLGYRKGPLAMYALREYLGEEQLNLALRNLLSKFKSGEPPFATSLDFYREIQAVTPDSLQYLLKDLFEINTYWELEMKEAGLKPADDGNWLVMMDVLARKVQVDTAGVETEIPMDDLIEVEVFGEGKAGIKNTLYLKKQRIRSGNNRIVVRVSQKPLEAGIDPRNLLIETEMYDNIREVTSAKKLN